MAPYDSVSRARAIAEKALRGEYDLFLACIDLARAEFDLAGVPADVRKTFIVVDSELDGVPIGPVREYWSREALAERDPVTERYRLAVRDEVIDALERLLVALQDIRTSKHDGGRK